MHNFSIFAVFFLLVSGYSSFALAESALAESDALLTVQQRAAQLKLAEQDQWQTLLHYQHDSSLVTDAAFFFHPAGAQDKQAELNATLAAFFHPSNDDDNSPQCLFPARFAWLQQQLAFKIQVHRCQKLHQWLKNLNVTGITLIFPVAYLNNPASMFGHSFLRLDSTQTELMAWTVNYAAVTEQERGLTFAVKGLFGGYHGQFSLAPYYVLLKEYADLESRDLWEYRLQFSPAEQERLLLHLWEIQTTHFDYYFINKNCSFQLLALLEVARPSLHLIQHFQWDAIPADTVRALTALPDLLQQVHYRPALATQISAKARALSPAQQTLAKSLVQGELSLTNQVIKQLAPLEQAHVLELAFAYLNYVNASKIKHNEAIDGQLAYDLLTARSLLPAQPLAPASAVPDFRPDQGHAGHRLQIAAGYDGNAPYSQFAFRWSYHDLTDPAEGFVPGAQVDFFKPALRYYPQQQRFQFEALDFMTIHSLPAGNDFIQPLSWQVSLGLNRQRFPDKERPLMGTAKFGVGMSYQLNEQTLLSVLARSSLLMGNLFKQNMAVGLGASFYAQHDFSPRWRISTDATITRYWQGITQTAYSYAMTQRVSLSTAQALVFTLGQSNEFDRAAFNAQLAWQFYF